MPHAFVTLCILLVVAYAPARNKDGRLDRPSEEALAEEFKSDQGTPGVRGQSEVGGSLALRGRRV